MRPAADPIDLALDALRRIDGVLEREQAALRHNDIAALKTLAAEKSAGLAPLTALLARIRRSGLAASPKAGELADRLERCRERNRANGMLMNLQAARRQSGAGALGLQQTGYGRHGVTGLAAASRRIARV